MSSEVKIESFFYILILGMLYFMQYQDLGGSYMDTDNYMHALRTMDFMNNPSLSERIFTQTNYPFGEISHWTRLMDILMTVCTLPFLFFEDLKSAVYDGSFLLVPLSALMTFLFLHKLGGKFLGTGSRFALYIMLLVSFPFKLVFKINRPDHHAVIIAFAAWLLWLLFQYTDKQQRKTVYWAAFVCGISLWLAVEGVFLYACTLIFLYLGYLLFNFSYKDLVRFACSYAAAVVFFWIINPPFQGYFYADNGRISFLFAALATVIAGVIYSGEKIRKKTLQFLFLSICALLCLAGLYYGGYLISPLNPEITVAFTDRIGEMQGGGSIYCLAYPLLGIVFLVLMFVKRINLPFLLLLTCFVLPYSIATLFAMRFNAYAILFGAVAIAYWVEQKHFGTIKYIFAVILLCLTDFISFTIDALQRYDLTAPLKSTPMVNIGFFKDYHFPDGAIASDIFLSPQIIWYANRPTVASPYHRNVEGIVDNNEILTSSDMNKVAGLIKKHKVASIVLPIVLEEDYYRDPEKNSDKLYGKMYQGKDYPEWLEEDMSARARDFIVVKVIADKLPQE